MKKIISIALIALTLMLSVLPTANATTITDEAGKSVALNEFYDVGNHWCKNTANKWYSFNIIKGIKEKVGKQNVVCFKPNQNITRRDMCVIIDRLMNYSLATSNKYFDLDNGQYYTDAVLKCVANGVISDNNGYLRPHDNATKEEVLDMLCKAFKLETISGSTKFIDDGSIANQYRLSVVTMYRAGYVNGTPQNYLQPKKSVTRAEAITLINNLVTTYYCSTGTTGNSSDRFKGNALINGKNVKLQNSIIEGNIYIANGSVALENSKVYGVIVVLDSNSSITITDSHVSSIEIYGKNATIKDGTMVDNITIKADGAKITGTPEYLTVFPKHEATVNGTTVYNESSYNNLVLDDKEQMKEITKDQGKINGGPTSTTGTLDKDDWKERRITLVNNSVKKGDYDIDEVGILLSQGRDCVPTLEDYDYIKKMDYSKVHLDNKYQLSFSTTCKRNTIYGYRAYAKDDEGNIAYGKIVYVEYIDD